MSRENKIFWSGIAAMLTFMFVALFFIWNNFQSKSQLVEDQNKFTSNARAIRVKVIETDKEIKTIQADTKEAEETLKETETLLETKETELAEQEAEIKRLEAELGITSEEEPNEENN